MLLSIVGDDERSLEKLIKQYLAPIKSCHGIVRVYGVMKSFITMRWSDGVMSSIPCAAARTDTDRILGNASLR